VVRVDLVQGKRPDSSLPRILGGLLLLAGFLLLALGWPRFFSERGLKYAKLAEMKAGDASFPDLQGRYSAEGLNRYRISRDDEAAVILNVVTYRDEQGGLASAIVFPPGEQSGQGLMGRDEGLLRRDLWNSAAEAVRAHTGEEAPFVTWWDNAQRLRFLTGRKGWVASPVAGAYPDGEDRRFWQSVGGRFQQDEERLRQLARWLTMDAEQALAEMSAVVSNDRPVYFLMCVDDLARLAEMETLSGVKLPFEVRNFPSAADVHTQIAEVKRWANEKGVGAYLVRQLPTGGIRAWRISTPEGARTLLARLMPFTTSLARPLEAMSLVYQSGWGAYISIYEWRH